jgi:hypothetical protein
MDSDLHCRQILMYGQFDLPRSSDADRKVFTVNSPSAGAGWQRFTRNPGTTMMHILALGGGGGGGAGAVGANSTAAGGGGGGSGGQTAIIIPCALLPETIFVSVGAGGAAGTAGIASRISVFPDTTANHTIAFVNGGGAGGAAAGATAGAAGAAGAVASAANMPLEM